jgi:hypothetical protein
VTIFSRGHKIPTFDVLQNTKRSRKRRGGGKRAKSRQNSAVSMVFGAGKHKRCEADERNINFSKTLNYTMGFYQLAIATNEDERKFFQTEAKCL